MRGCLAMLTDQGHERRQKPGGLRRPHAVRRRACRRAGRRFARGAGRRGAGHALAPEAKKNEAERRKAPLTRPPHEANWFCSPLESKPDSMRAFASIPFVQRRLRALCIGLGLTLLATAGGSRPLAAESPAELGDRFYARGEYDLARIEYERALGLAGETERRALEARIGLAEIRRERYRSAVEALRDAGDFSHLYLRLFASLRLGWQNQAIVEADRIERLTGADALGRGRAQLLLGLIFLDRADHTAARSHYSFLMKDSEAEEVRQVSARVLSALDEYERTPQKSPWLAGGLSALLPGAGQIYSEHYVDGVTAFFFNGMFLGSAAIMYDLENRANRPHVASAAFGVVGVFFYLANVFGAAQSAHRYNTYQTRLFHQEVRDTFFNVDYVDRTSGIVIEVRF